ncbi:MAG: GDSL-type esterase/lipase family protein [Ruminococcus sp.]|nr:GDSL-type esterase/lipase family protein [Ruminococcus sp.]
MKRACKKHSISIRSLFLVFNFVLLTLVSLLLVFAENISFNSGKGYHQQNTEIGDPVTVTEFATEPGTEPEAATEPTNESMSTIDSTIDTATEPTGEQITTVEPTTESLPAVDSTTDTPDDPVISFLVGDINSDGKVNGIDSAVLQRYLSGWDGFFVKLKNIKAADIDGEGNINGADTAILMRYASGWEQYKSFIRFIEVSGFDSQKFLKGKKLYIGGDSIMRGYGSNGYAIGEYLRDKYGMTITNGALSGATLSTLYKKSICNQMNVLEKDYDVIIFDGGINDVSKDYPLGELSIGFDNDFNTKDTIGALEAICQHLTNSYPNAKKLFIITHEMTTNSFQTNTKQIEFMNELIPVLKKWEIPYINMIDSGLKAYNKEANEKYFYNADRLHPNAEGYRTFYFKRVEKALIYGIDDSDAANLLN